VHVSVEDDGVGFNVAEVASAAARTGGFGLFSIRERLEQLGGHLEIESKPGRGTTVTLTAPLKDEKDQSSAPDKIVK
jgi:signal transduction histidine kinase